MHKILTKDGSPFKTAQAAAIFAGRLKLEKGTFEIVPEGEKGYAIESQVEVSTTRPEEGAEAPVVKKHKVTTPWRPATLLDIPERYKDPNFVYRFCDTKKDGNIQKKTAEGWEIDRELSRKMKQSRPTIEDGGRVDTTTGVRELIVMRMPKEVAEARNKYFEDLAGANLKKSADELKEATSESGGESYGEIKVETY